MSADATLRTHAHRTESAREYAVAQLAYHSALLTVRAAEARYEQARAMLTYLENIDHALTRE